MTKKKKKLDTDGSHATAEAWPQAYHSTPPSEAPHKPVLLQGQSLDLAWASFWAVISCPLVFPGMCPAGINCPKPTHQRLLSFFFSFPKQNFLPDSSPLCGSVPSANASPSKSFSARLWSYKDVASIWICLAINLQSTLHTIARISISNNSSA